MIALVVFSMHVVDWLFYYYLFVPDYLEKYIPQGSKETAGDQLVIKTAEIDSFKEMNKNPAFVIPIIYLEVFRLELSLHW